MEKSTLGVQVRDYEGKFNHAEGQLAEERKMHSATTEDAVNFIQKQESKIWDMGQMTVLFLTRAMEEVKKAYLEKHPNSDVNAADFLNVDFVRLTESTNARLATVKEAALESGVLPVKVPQWREKSLPGTPSAHTKEARPS